MKLTKVEKLTKDFNQALRGPEANLMGLEDAWQGLLTIVSDYAANTTRMRALFLRIIKHVDDKDIQDPNDYLERWKEIERDIRESLEDMEV